MNENYKIKYLGSTQFMGGFEVNERKKEIF